MKRSVPMVLTLLTAALISAATAQQPRSVFTVVTSAPWGTRNLNPFVAPAQRLGPTNSAIYESLFFVNTLNGKVTPVLGTKSAWSKDNKTLTVTTRSGVKWHDGRPFGARDVAFTFNFLKRTPALDLNGVWKGGLQAVRATSPDTVVFTFSQTNTPHFLFIAHTPVVAEHLWKDVKEGATFTNPNPVGTGPFTFETYSMEALRVLKNPDYWIKGKPEVDALVWVATTTNDAAMLRLLKGQANFGFLGMSDPKTGYADKGTNTTFWWPVVNMNVLTFNTAKAPFNDRAFRRAVAQAIDTGEVTRKAYGNSTPAADPSGIIPSQLEQWLPAGSKAAALKFDPAAADRALTAAGYRKDAQGNRLGKDGQPLPTFKILVGAGWTDFITIAQVVGTNLSKLGIKTQIDQQSFGAWFSSVQTGTFDLAPAPLGSVPGPNPYYNFNAAFAPENSAPVGKPATSNWSRYINPEMTRALQSFRATANPAQQQKAVATMVTLFMRDVPVVPLTARTQFALFNTTGFTNFPSAQNPYNDAASERDVGARLLYMNVKPK